jgi:putative PIN family toxin of toxin-antitoxin system
MQPLKVVFDTNIYVMAAGMPGGYIDYWLDMAKPPERKFQLYTSPVILAEVQEKLEQKLKFERPLAVEYITATADITIMVNPRMTLDEVPSDPDDNRILECAAEAQADIILSADKDLLKLKTFRNIQITHPSNLKYIFRYLENNT